MSKHEHHIAEYLAGRMNDADRAAFEAVLQESESLRHEVETLRDATELLGEAFAEDTTSEYRLRADRRERILAEARGDVITFPSSSAFRRTPAVRSHRGYYRRHAGLVAAAIAVVLGGVLGHEAGREQFDTRVVPSQVTIEGGETQVASDATEAVHPYPPAYGLDLPGAWRLRSASPSWRPAVGYARVDTTLPAYVGLPGPRSEYLAARNADRTS